MGLRGAIDHYVSLPPNSTPRARGVRYFMPITLYKAYWGAMNSVKAGRRYKKHIVVRRTFLSSSLDESFILKPVAPFSG